MSATLYWSLVYTMPPHILTEDGEWIDLAATDPNLWLKHISPKQQQNVLEKVRRWQIAVDAGACAQEAFEYAVGGEQLDFPDWLEGERDYRSR